MGLQLTVIIELLSRYDIGLIKQIKPILTSGNRSFLITTDADHFFLRLAGDGHRSRTEEELEGELDLLDKLKTAGFPVMEYLLTTTGDRVVNLENHYGYLRKYLAGEFVQGNPSEKHLIAVGKSLGQYHRLVANHKIVKRDNINFGLSKTKKFFAASKEEILNGNFNNINEFVRQFVKEISELNFPANLTPGMLHEDLGKRHVIWRENKIAAFIDFDRSYYGPLILDIGQALRGWCFIDSWKNWSAENARIFLAGYETERKLSDLEKEFLVPAIKFAILERALSYCLRYIYSKNPNKGDEKFALESLFKQLPKITI